MTFAINTIASASSALTMSSREIAELLDCRHDNVKVTIERLVDKGVIVQPAMQDEPSKDAMGRTRITSVYHVGKRDSYVIVAQLSPEFTAALVDRWQALEATKAPAIPQTFSQALLLAAKLEEERAVLALENSKQAEVIAEQAPKAEFFDELVNTSEVYTPTQVASLLGNKNYTTAQKVNDLLWDMGWQYKRGRQWVATKLALTKGYLQSKVYTNEDTGHSGTHVRITVEGLNTLRASIEA